MIARSPNNYLSCVENIICVRKKADLHSKVCMLECECSLLLLMIHFAALFFCQIFFVNEPHYFCLQEKYSVQYLCFILSLPVSL